MAREAYRSLYGDLAKLKDDAGLKDPATGTGVDTELFQLLMAVSEQIDNFCNRTFYPHATTRLFDGSGNKILLISDLLTITTLKEDQDANLTFENTWASTDYFTRPFNAEPTQHWGEPYTSLKARDAGDELIFTAGEQNFQIVGVWGYRNLVEASSTLINNEGGYDDAATSLVVDSGPALEIGQTIRIGSEDLLVTGISVDTLTVTRGLNGTAAASMLDNATIDIVRFPLPIERAAIIQAARIWTRAPTFEPFYVDSAIDTDVREMIDPYVRPVV